MLGLSIVAPIALFRSPVPATTRYSMKRPMAVQAAHRPSYFRAVVRNTGVLLRRQVGRPGHPNQRIERRVQQSSPSATAKALKKRCLNLFPPSARAQEQGGPGGLPVLILVGCTQ